MRASTSGIVVTSRQLKWVLAAVAATGVGTLGCGSDTPLNPTPITITCPVDQAADSMDGNPLALGYDAPVTNGGIAPVTTACSPASGSLFAVGATTVVCRASDSAGRSATCTFTVTVRVPLQLRYTQLTAFGDSITEGKASEPVSAGSALFRELSRSGPAQAEQAFYQSPEPYPAGVERRLTAAYPTQTFTVVNAGLGGEKAASAVPRFRGMLASTDPEVVLLMEGSNDLSSATGIEPAIAGLDEMVTDALSQGRRVCLATIPPIRPDGLANRAASSLRVAPFNDRVRALAARRGVVLVEVYNAMKDDIDTLIGLDDLHPTEQGIAVIADTFTAALRANFQRTPPAPAAHAR